MTKKRILVVGEDAAIFSGIKLCMESDSIDVYRVTSPAEALKCFTQQEYCMVIMEFYVPGINDFETLRTMRSTRNLPILALTDHLDSEEKIALFHAGANAYMERPVNTPVPGVSSRAVLPPDSTAKLDSAKMCADRDAVGISQGI